MNESITWQRFHNVCSHAATSRPIHAPPPPPSTLSNMRTLPVCKPQAVVLYDYSVWCDAAAGSCVVVSAPETATPKSLGNSLQHFSSFLAGTKHEPP
jgi:hypothetical protein